MRNYCTITPTRGDRKELLNFMIARMPANIENIVVDYPPESNEIDLIPRIKKGLEIAKSKGFEYAVIIEDDDYYPESYFDNDFTSGDFFGYDQTTYYNLKYKTYQVLNHPSRSSLFCTAFRIGALDEFRWPSDKVAFLDIWLWEFANNYRFNKVLLHDNPCIGIKHGIGLCAGKAHKLSNGDHDPEFLKYRVDKDAYEFYKKLSERL